MNRPDYEYNDDPEPIAVDLLALSVLIAILGILILRTSLI